MSVINRLNFFAAALALGLAGLGTIASAAVVQSTGTGSAVTSVEAVVDFEDTGALSRIYTENGLQIERVSLSTNNNGCGYAGCGYAFPGFSGNYFYGAGSGHLAISTTGDQVLTGLEFAFGWYVNHNIVWEAYLDGARVDQGRASRVAGGTILSFSGEFDTLLFSSSARGGDARLNGGNNSPGIDSLRAQFLTTVPVPASGLLLMSLLATGAAVARRRKS